MTNCQALKTTNKGLKMQTITHTVYKFNELSAEAKQTAIEAFKNDTNYLDYNWWDFTYDDVVTILEFIGFSNIDISFTGFSSQGDGASFTGNYEYAKGGVKKLVSYAPSEKVFINAAKQLQALQRKYFYKIFGKVERISSHYVHENTVTFSVDYSSVNTLQSVADIEQEITEIVRTISQYIYSKLENEYNYLMSDNAIIEHITCNDYLFNEDGTIY